MNSKRWKIRMVVWVGAAAYLGWRLLMLGGTWMFGGPGEPSSALTFEELWLRNAAGQWYRDEMERFIIGLTFCVAMSIAVILATLRWKLRSRVATGFWGSVRVVGIFLCLAAFGFTLARLGGKSTCEGNVAAIAACRSIVINLEAISSERTNAPVSIAEIKASEADSFSRLPGLNLLPPARILIAPTPISCIQSGTNNIVAVCDTPFDNVPRRLFEKNPPTHAVSYTDYTWKLISVEQFKQLDLSGFVDVRTVIEKARKK